MPTFDHIAIDCSQPNTSLPRWQEEIAALKAENARLQKRLDSRPFEFSDDENVEPEFLEWWRAKDFAGYPWTRREVQLIALLAWRHL